MAAETDASCEIEVLQSIYLDELTVAHTADGGWTVSVLLHPSTGEDCLAQFVRLTLTLDLDPEYPSSPPRISVHNPRGLSDDKLLSLEQSLQMEVESCAGMPVLYQLIEKAKEILTESNIPHGICVICLYGFKEGDAFTKTSCYHYFHSHCLGRYVTHSEEELRERVRELEEDKTRDGADEEDLCVVCPVCREPLECDVTALLSSPVPSRPQQQDGAAGAEFRRKWAEELQKILQRQKEKGGIIDPEAESNRFLIHINEAPAEASDTLCSDAPNPEPSQSSPSSPPELPNRSPPPARPPSSRSLNASQRRAPHGRRPQGDFRGGRRGRGRGGGGRSGQEPSRTARPVHENLAKLSLSSAECSRVRTSPPPVDQDPSSDAEKEQTNQPIGEESVITPHQETAGSKCDLDARAADSGDSAQNDGPQERANQVQARGRRHGPRGPPYGHWHDRNAQWEHSGGSFHHGGGRGRRGFSNHRRGSAKSTHQRTEGEFRKEGVL